MTAPAPLPLGVLQRSIAVGVGVLRRSCDVDITFGGPYDPANPASIAIKSMDGNIGHALRNLRVTTGYGVGGKALALGRPVAISDYLHATQIVHAYDSAVVAERLASVAAIPVLISGAPRGMLYLATRSETNFGSRILSQAVAAARHIERDILIEEGVRRRLAIEAARRSDGPGRVLPAGELDDLRSELDGVIEHVRDAEARRRLEAVSRRLLALAGGAPVPDQPAVSGALTGREVQVLRHVARGQTNQQIARAVGLTANTVKTYLQTAARKLGAGNRTQAAMLAREAGVID